MRVVVLLLLVLFSVGCQCETQEVFMRAHDLYIQRLYNWIPADSEALKYKDREAEARAYLKTIRESATLYLISEQLQRDGFHWAAENFDHTSYAWVTIARRRGDCDDFMVLWEEILKFRGGTTKRITVTSPDSAHAMLFFYQFDNLYLLSNLRVLGVGKQGDEEKLVRLHYGDRTRCWIAY